MDLHTEVVELTRDLVRLDTSNSLGVYPGNETLAASTTEEPDAIEDMHEPFLIQLGFIERTPRGRLATARAYDYFGRTMPGRGLF